MARGSGDTPTLWDDRNVPSADDEEFKQFIDCQERVTFAPKPEQCRTWDNAPNPKTHFSFGENGTTATTNAYGDILQFGTFIGEGQSGMFSADHAYVSEPYLIDDRTKELHELCSTSISDNTQTYGLSFNDFHFEGLPRQTWINYRWPRYESIDQGKRTTTIQWMVHDGVVLQHNTVTNLGDDDLPLSFVFKGFDDRSMQIRDLDHVDPGYRLNENYRGHKITNGLHGYSWILSHKLQSPPILEASSATFSDTLNAATGRNYSAEEQDSVAVVVSVFLNGKTLKWGHPDSWETILAGRQKRTIATNWFNSGSASTAEVVIAYKMVLVPVSKAHWKDFLIPAAYIDIGKFINEEPSPAMCLSTLPYPINHEDQQDGTPRLDTNTENISIPGLKSRKWSGEPKEDSPAEPSGIPFKDASSQADNASSSPGPHNEYIVRRNLEHILSVCSIPLRRPPLEADGQATDEVIPVALTCGDMSFHRIIASASFFAFQFLLDIARRLKRPELDDNSYVQWLRKRITLVCKGHFRWISEKAQKSEIRCFVANYWVTGKIISQKSASWRPDDSLTDNPFQIIKVGNHSHMFPEDRSKSIATIRDIYLPWIGNLEKLDKRRRFAWPHAQQSDINVFRLDDHLWIWKALRVIDDLGLWSHLDSHQSKPDETTTQASEQQEHMKKWARTYGFRNVQREMLRRFTTESDVSRKRMLAVFRSPRETRFLFHARDTALFYEYAEFLLPETSFRQVWENTIEAQKHHDENQETRWDNALRYALAIVMGMDGHSINKEKSPTQLVTASLSVLLKSSSPNGLFAGQLDETTKEPILFYHEAHRDFYFHAGFEIPFIILTRAAEVNKQYRKKIVRSRDTSRQREILHDDIAEYSERLTTQPKRQLVGLELDASNFPQLQQNINRTAQQSQTMKKIMPFNRFIDSTSIVEIQEEWLYNYPAVFTNEKSLSVQDVQEQLARYLIENKGTRSFRMLIIEDGELAANIIRNDAELRNKLCKILNGVPARVYVELVADSENQEMRQKLNSLLKHEILPQARDFLTSGELPKHTSIDTSAPTSSNSSLNLNSHNPLLDFFNDEDISETMERILCEDTNALIRNVKNHRSIRLWMDMRLLHDPDDIVRITLRNKVLLEKFLALFELESLSEHVVLRAAKVYLERLRNWPSKSDNGEWDIRTTTGSTIAVADTEKKRTQGKRSKVENNSGFNWKNNLELWKDYLNVPRTAKTAKKRFIYIETADIETALVCYLGTPEVERTSISLFFDRHQNYSLHFFDDTTMVSNTWETEFHMSYYQLVREVGPKTPKGIPTLRNDILSGGKGSQITKASMGFRFFGDIFDRYWTCHYIEFIPAGPEAQRWKMTSQFNSKDRAIRQRKILELVLFDHILGNLVHNTKQIVDKIKFELGVRQGALSFVNLQSDDYFSSSDHWQESQQTLQAIEDHMEHVIVIVAKWDTREKDRGMEKPRWTHNDEWKYRGDLKKVIASNNSKIRDMNSLHAEIKTLKEYLMRRQDQIRNDLSLRGAENIRFFTYVTVVFLPLGFSASIFSMSGTPDGLLIGYMASAAAVALVLTVFALINAETLGAVAGTISRNIALYSDLRMRNSHLLEHYRTSKQLKTSVGDPNNTGNEQIQMNSLESKSQPNETQQQDTNASRQIEHPRETNDWHLWFWIVYILIELPARSVALAYGALRAQEWTSAAFFNVALGVLLLPWCILSCLFQVVVFNLMDLLYLLRHLAKDPFSAFSSNEDPFYGNTVFLLRPGTKLRPFLKMDLKIRKKKEDKSLQEDHTNGGKIERNATGVGP